MRRDRRAGGCWHWFGHQPFGQAFKLARDKLAAVTADPLLDGKLTRAERILPAKLGAFRRGFRHQVDETAKGIFRPHGNSPAMSVAAETGRAATAEAFLSRCRALMMEETSANARSLAPAARAASSALQSGSRDARSAFDIKAAARVRAYSSSSVGLWPKAR
jgi:hypothetical protein